MSEGYVKSFAWKRTNADGCVLQRHARQFANEQMKRTPRDPPPEAVDPAQATPNIDNLFSIKRSEPITSDFNVLSIRLLVQKYLNRYPVRRSVPMAETMDCFTHYIEHVFTYDAKKRKKGKDTVLQKARRSQRIQRVSSLCRPG